MKKIIVFYFLFLGLLASHSFANDHLKITAKVYYFSEWGDSIDEDSALEAGWSFDENSEEWSLSEQVLSISQLPYKTSLGDVDVHIRENRNSKIELSVGYSDSDNDSEAAAVLHRGVKNSLSANGNDNSSWSYSAEIEVDYTSVD